MFICYTTANVHMGIYEYWVSFQESSDMCWYLAEQCFMIPKPIGDWECD